MENITVFEENLFFIIEKICCLRKCLRYDLDAKIVSEKVHEDIVFIYEFLINIDDKMQNLVETTVTPIKLRVLLRAFSNLQALVRDSMEIRPSFFANKTNVLLNSDFLKIITSRTSELKEIIYKAESCSEKNIYISQDELTMLLNP
ncbi:MAG: hypothetical protein JXR63_13160 [Spirochaetales bacterium]|nr:hypothetical protein [Spirochaetales bacterium]